MGPLQKPRAYQESFRGSFAVLWEKRTSELSPTWGAASDMAARASVLRLSFFFFFFFSLDSCRLGFNWRWFALNRANSARIGPYRLNWVVLTGDQNGHNRPKSALNHAGTAKISFEWDPNILNLSFLNFILNICCFFCVFFFVLCFVVFLTFFFLCFVNQGHSNVFSKNILIVKIYWKYK